MGKTSIIKVLFSKQHPHDTQHLDSTAELEVTEVDFEGFFRYQVFDFPGTYDAEVLTENGKNCIKNCGAVIYVVDSRVRLFDRRTKIIKMLPNISKAIISSSKRSIRQPPSRSFTTKSILMFEAKINSQSSGTLFLSTWKPGTKKILVQKWIYTTPALWITLLSKLWVIWCARWSASKSQN